jgi:HEAT repeat protein
VPGLPGQKLNSLELAARYAAAGAGAARVPVAELAGAARDDPDARVRVAALGALVRGAGRSVASAAWRRAVTDRDAAVRRRATELAPALAPPPVTGLLTLLDDDDPLVAESAAWALGEVEWSSRTRARVGRALSGAATRHPDPLVRESAVAALGALGDPAGLPAVLAACADRPAIRRRAVLALAPFSGAEVDAALARALTDPDWQVRQAAEDLTT